VLNNLPIRNPIPSPIRRRCALLPAVALAASSSRLARASILTGASNCSASSDPLKCRLLGFLDLLYAAAGVLALVLIAVVAIAIKIYLENKKSEKKGL
jgi:hypothetical protein